MASLLRACLARKLPFRGCVHVMETQRSMSLYGKVTSSFPLYSVCSMNYPSTQSTHVRYTKAIDEKNSSLDVVKVGSYRRAHTSGFSLPSWVKGLSCGVGLFLAAYILLNKEQCIKNPVEKSLQHIVTFLFPTAQCSISGSNRPSKRFNFLAEAVELASPSVVYVERSQRVATMFGEIVGVSSGSGFIVYDGRYVLTNAHVVANSRSVEVKISTGRMVHGEVTDIDQVADLALIKLKLPDNESLPALTFGSSTTLRPGEWVVALGSPLNLTNTITAGIVSSVLRPSKELGLEHYKPDMEYVQTDAPITHGNSGGPLVNLDGEVIGVNTMTAGPGISFAIPSDFAQNFVEKATKTVKEPAQVATRYAIGVSMLSINPSIIRVILQRISLPQDVTHGVFLANVWQNSPADRAGLRTGDVIVRINGKNVYTSKDVNKMVQTGVKLVMEVVRKSKWMTVTVVPEPLHSGV